MTIHVCWSHPLVITTTPAILTASNLENSGWVARMHILTIRTRRYTIWNTIVL